MPRFLYVLGLVSIIGGGWWIWATLLNPLGQASAETAGFAVMAGLVAAGPGYTLLLFGFLMLAMGAILEQLKAIRRGNAALTNAIDDLADQMRPPASD